MGFHGNRVGRALSALALAALLGAGAGCSDDDSATNNKGGHR